jgi:hypothetical protein
MTTTTKEDKRRRRSDDDDEDRAAPSKKSSREVRIKVVKPAKASASAQAPAALAPFVGYLAHGRLGAAAKAAQTIGGGAGGGGARGAGGSSSASDPDGTKAAARNVHFDVYEKATAQPSSSSNKRSPVYVAQLAGPRRGNSSPAQERDEEEDDEALAAARAAPRLLLVGRTDGAEQHGASAAGWYAVGVYSRSKGTLTLARAQDGRLARVEPVLPEGVAAALAAKRRADLAAKEDASAAAREQSKRLVDAFGSTRRKRQLQAREEGAVRSDRLLEGGAGVQAALARVNAAALAGDGAATREAVLARAAAARNVPPHDPTATRAHEAYRVRSFFTPAFWDALNAGQLLAASEDAEQMAKLRERGLVPGYVLSRCEALLRPTVATGGGGKGGAAGAKEGTDPAAASQRRWRAKLLAAVAAMLTLHAGRASVRVPAVPGGLGDAAKRLRICARGEALEAILDTLYVPAGRVEGDDPAAAAASAAAEAAEAAAVKLEAGGGEGAGGEGEGGPSPASTKKPPRAPRPAADVFVRDDRQKALALAYALVIALDAEGWRLSPEVFESLRAELKVPARDLALRFRELGAECTSSPTAGGTASYSVALLQRLPPSSAAGGSDKGKDKEGTAAEAAGPRTLEMAFPKAKRPATQRR